MSPTGSGKYGNECLLILCLLVGCGIQKGGIIICLGQNGSPSGDALVRFEDRESQETAMGFHKKNMGQR